MASYYFFALKIEKPDSYYQMLPSLLWKHNDMMIESNISATSLIVSSNFWTVVTKCLKSGLQKKIMLEIMFNALLF